MSDQARHVRAWRFPVLSDDVRARSLVRTMRAAPCRVPWVFAYGSLMWNPCFSWSRREPVILDGHRRRFCVWTTCARGTPERPGVGLGLEDAPGECKGIAYRLDARSLERDLEALWDREMMSGIYRPTWVEAPVAGTVTRVLVFVVDPSHPQYAHEMCADTMASIIAVAAGTYGTCREYLANTIEQMAKLGVCDPDFDALLARVDRKSGVRPD